MRAAVAMLAMALVGALCVAAYVGHVVGEAMTAVFGAL